MAVVPAAGRGARMGTSVPKQFLFLAGLPLVGHVLRTLEDCPRITGVVLVAAPGEEDYCREEIVVPLGLNKVAAVVAGGRTRQESVYRGLAALPRGTDIVVVHDGARPLLGRAELDRVVDAAARHGAATCAVPAKDTVKMAGEDFTVAETLPRERLWLTQTPQAFRFQTLMDAHVRARESGRCGTDDAVLVEMTGRPVKLVPGSYENIKVTTPEDLVVAEALVSARTGKRCGKEKREGSMRTGFGYDVHRLVDGRPLVLGGVTVPYKKGLAGHSDADVLVHAVMDALLGAAGAGDIGRHFPDSDPRFKGISSLILLERVGSILRCRGFAVENIDTVVVAQEPKLAPFTDRMKAAIAAALGMEGGRVGVKATTTEGLGFTGTGEGIAAYATVLISGGA
ncbi:MAG: 2-C-methyl-D-erythritol 4-phosphate cytidylyltransferase [Firmicutes bacterium]|nr:2-C-methyl-D-erythritol 4-phosphate cytidylyltransferase [Bacillota bacterium]